jgi:hypothetical protein
MVVLLISARVTVNSTQISCGHILAKDLTVDSPTKHGVNPAGETWWFSTESLVQGLAEILLASVTHFRQTTTLFR